MCDDDDIHLLVQHDRGIEDLSDPEPPLTAAAVAAYQRNNHSRVMELDLPALDEITFPPCRHIPHILKDQGNGCS
ncbi:hypothetical protein A0H81_02779 [Grifola frondosa]|uniref:Uncharacterized protein n=1 Tax=Grifola frondosa TaxID=5627 RepID=A0A1C7MMP2_GRIFR|nr:hypothetical protein A0H81_02779 [Grifola frondosa]